MASPRALWLAMILIAAGVAVTLLPWFMLTRADKRATRCLREIEDRGEGSASGCLPASGDLVLPLRLPWLRDDARHIQQGLALRAARVAYDQATAAAPDVLLADPVATNLLGLTNRGGASDATAALRLVGGSFGAIAGFARTSQDASVLAFGLKSARAIADLGDMQVLALTHAAGATAADDLRRGALLCLLGDRDAGARALSAADGSWEHDGGAQPLGLARVASRACGRQQAGTGEVAPREVSASSGPALAALAASQDASAGDDPIRALLDEEKRAPAGIQRLRLAPFIIRKKQLTALQALRLLAPRGAQSARIDLRALRTPWSLLGAEQHALAVLVDTNAAETAATELGSLAEKLGAEPLDCSGQECPDTAALKLPDAILLEGARMLWLDDAAEHARLGHREAAKRAVERATDLAVPARRYLGASILLAVGDAAGALDLLAGAVAAASEYPPPAQVQILTDESLARAHLGEFDQAMDAAHAAYLAARADRAAPPGDARRGSDRELSDDRVAAAWLLAATSLLAGKPEQAGETLTGASGDLAVVSEWLARATMPESQRRPERREWSLPAAGEAALPAAMAVAGFAVPRDRDVEVWLDRIFQDEHRNRPVRAMLARAEAARWRGDRHSEERWRLRAEKLLALVKDYPTAVLAHIFEIR